MSTPFTNSELAAFLDEALPAERSSELEKRLRDDQDLRTRLTEIRGREAAGLHSVGGVWRRERLSCPSRDELGQFILETLPDEHRDYIRFHLETIGCRYCQANLADLEQASSPSEVPTERRRRYFQTSAGYLRK